MNGAEPRPAESEHLLERLVFFSDAVFAIAITLLVIEIHIPELPAQSDNDGAWRELLHIGPSLFAFALSFLVIGRFWMGHHRAFGAVRHYDERMVWPNLQYLLGVAFMPFATAFLGRNFGHFVPALVYNATMLFCALLNWRLWRVLLRTGALPVDRSADFGWRPVSLMLGAATSVALTFVWPLISQIGMATMPIWGMLLRRISK